MSLNQEKNMTFDIYIEQEPPTHPITHQTITFLMLLRILFTKQLKVNVKKNVKFKIKVMGKIF